MPMKFLYLGVFPPSINTFSEALPARGEVKLQHVVSKTASNKSPGQVKKKIPHNPYLQY